MFIRISAAITLVLGQFGAMYLLFSHHLAYALSLHLGLVFAGMLSLHLQRNLPFTSLAFLTSLALVLPFFGPLMLALCLVYLKEERKAGFLSHYHQYLEFQRSGDPVELLRREKEIREEFRQRESWKATCTIGNTQKDQQHLLQQLSLAPVEKAAPILQILRMDENHDIAARASKMYFDLEQKELQVLHRLELQCQQFPTQEHSWNQWSRALVEYVELGFADKEQRDIFWNKATHALLQSLKCEPGQINCHLALGRLYIKQGHNHLALEQLLKAQELEPENSTIKSWLAELHYNSGKYAQTAQLMHEIQGQDGKLSDWREFWQRGSNV